jgi:hypothetical protein
LGCLLKKDINCVKFFAKLFFFPNEEKSFCGGTFRGGLPWEGDMLANLHAQQVHENG